MFFSQISDFEENFKFLDRLNVLLFNVWKDDNAAAYKTESMDQLEMFYRNYVNEMRQKSHEMSNLMNEIEDNILRLSNIQQDLSILKVDSEIRGCGLGCASGQISKHEVGTEYFVVPRDQDPNQLEDVAFSQCEKLQSIDEAWYERPLV